MQIANNILETIGNTPLVKLNKITSAIPATVLAKVETFNPGNSIKDRMALKMIEEAEKSGELKPGGTIIEGTSGNTGMGLAIAAVIKGYKCIFTSTDKQSKEKFDALRALGAEVIVCPTDVDPEDPRSYYSVSSRLAKEVPNAWKPNQYDNLANSQAHYESTGPEIWEQTEGKITHLVVGVGTGGTICGTGKYLKEKNPNIKLIGIDSYGSIFKKYHETGVFDKSEIYPYVTEGIGEDFLPKNVDFSLIDHFEKVTDKDAALYTRKIALDEGIFVGNSAGAAIAGLLQVKDMFKPDDVVVVIFHDHGIRYMGKMFNPAWMQKMGYLPTEGLTAADLIQANLLQKVVTIDSQTSISETSKILIENDFSQIPVSRDERIVGTISEDQLFEIITTTPEKKEEAIEDYILPALPFVDPTASVSDINEMLKENKHGVLVRDFKTQITYIITKHDVIKATA
ncbi:pyridoxal-phosphate dependent enzyme [Luteibaculum oceani]|uniref:Pyridoxal-phosphate dependent enzyme n=1 Tax=Luteibaculum oceani TaxID=1294296 RepID=A0A5C6VB48_9FLAO|nr:pyridoxal-phosphate dependent enzyme [Luteibaculum oceani]TXC81616.1 pyridoxal-phosphate dependent enzyme [Luteibaculum oceani]